MLKEKINEVVNLNRKFWTDEEVKRLIEVYGEGIDKLREVFSYRSLSSIYHKANRLCLTGKTSKGFCRKCGLKLDELNWYGLRSDYICKKCLVNLNSERIKLDPEKYKKYCQESILHTNGKSYVCKKRPKPNECELCGDGVRRLSYHHYGKIKRNEYVKGIWVCILCHQFAEIFDKGYKDKYVLLREKICGKKRLWA